MGADFAYVGSPARADLHPERAVERLSQRLRWAEAGATLRPGRMRERRERVAVQLGRGTGELGEGCHQRPLGFVQLVEHRSVALSR